MVGGVERIHIQGTRKLVGYRDKPLLFNVNAIITGETAAVVQEHIESTTIHMDLRPIWAQILLKKHSHTFTG